jgi:hypothetical protein
MLTPTELNTLYTEAELLTFRDALKTQRTNILGGSGISSVQTRDLSVQFGVGTDTIEQVDSALGLLARALQMKDPTTYGTSLLRVRRKYII